MKSNSVFRGRRYLTEKPSFTLCMYFTYCPSLKHVPWAGWLFTFPGLQVLKDDHHATYPFSSYFPKSIPARELEGKWWEDKVSRGDRPRGTYTTMRDLVPNQIGGERSKVNYLCKHPAKHWAQWSGEYFQGEGGNSRSLTRVMISLFWVDQ